MHPSRLWPLPLFLLVCALFAAFAAEGQASALYSAGSDRGGASVQPQAPAARAWSERSLERTGRQGLPDVAVRYPAFGLPAVDEDLALWVEHMAGVFEYDCATQEHGEDQAETPPAWLSASFTVTSPSGAAASVVFDVWLRTGESEASEDILTLSYDLLTGRRLHFVDIFEDTDRALAILSERSRAALARETAWDTASAAGGTRPAAENFASIALIPEGVRVYFQSFQVTRWPGSRQVDIPLEALMPAGPWLALWGR